MALQCAMWKNLDHGQKVSKWLVNPSKCYKMSVTRSRSPVRLEDNQAGSLICSLTSLPDELGWNSHVHKIVKKLIKPLAYM